MGWISLWMEPLVILLSLAMPSRRNFDILEWLQIDSRSSALSQISATTVYVTMEFVAPNTGIPAAYWLATLLETTQDTLNHNTIDADAVPGISTGIAYDQEHNSFFSSSPLIPNSVNFFSPIKRL